MAQQKSTIPSGENLSRPMQAFLEKLDSRRPSDVTPVDPDTVTLPELAARFNTLLDDLNKR